MTLTLTLTLTLNLTLTCPQVECPAVTPEVVLQASGHVERFTDFMVTDAMTGEPYRADHLLEAHLETALEGGAKEPLSPEAKEVSWGAGS